MPLGPRGVCELGDVIMTSMTARGGPDEQNARATARTFGWLLARLYLFLHKRGKIRVEGYERAVSALAEGGFILASNHPEGSTPFLIPAIFHEKYFDNPRFFLWNMPREGLVPTQWLRDRLRCIVVERDNPVKKARAVRKAAKALKDKWNVLIFAEGTRTFDEKEPDATLIERNGRLMRPVDDTGLPFLAKLGDAQILPVWIRIPGVKRKLRFWASIFHLFKKRGRYMSIRFGEPYRIEEPFDIDKENARLQEKIFHT